MTTAIGIQPHQIPTLLDRFPAAKCLSLDCFDTLLWRDCRTPADVFAALGEIAPGQRARAERQARKAKELAGQGSEVDIAEIYAQLLGSADQAARDAAIRAELLAEARHCYAFAPTVELMRAAKGRGIEVVIVSDTYLGEVQLRELIAAAAGDEVAALADRIFCSCSFGKSKAGGLFADLLGKLDHRPGDILHLGDNYAADVEGALAHGINAVHLQQFSGSAEERMRQEAAIDALVHPRLGLRASALLPHRAALALGEPQTGDPAERLGLTMLGPVFHAFDGWLREEAEALAQQHPGKVHWLFLMRDGHLPHMVHQSSGDPSGHAHAAEISRFTATAAHLQSNEAIAAFVERELGQRPQTLARQLLMREDRAASLLEGLSLEDDSKALLRESRSGAFRKRTIRHARGFADRLCAHVRRLCDPAPGDVLMLVDLGYNGTVQNRIDALLAERLGVHVAGRYLLLREMDRPGLDKRGLIDARHYSPDLLDAMCANVALLEQLSTTPQGSVIDYSEHGEPVRRGSDIKQRQSEVRERVQHGVLAFQHHAAAAVVRADDGQDASLWRMAAATALMRAMYLPLAEELVVVERFQHDVNLGTDRVVPLFDRAKAQAGLRQRGLFYMNGSERMYLPAEIQQQSLETRLGLLVQRRFNLPFTMADFAGKTLGLPVTLLSGTQASRQRIEAFPTHGGFYTAAIPVGTGQYTVSLQFAELLEWLELDQLAFVAVEHFISGTHEELRCEVPAAPIFDGVQMMAGRLLQCQRADGQVLVQPPQDTGDRPMLLACTFRPLVFRAAAEAAKTERLSA